MGRNRPRSPNLHSSGVSLPGSVRETWELVHSVLEPLQTDSEEEMEGETEDQIEEREDREDTDKESETAPTVVPKSLYPNLGRLSKGCLSPSNSFVSFAFTTAFLYGAGMGAFKISNKKITILFSPKVYLPH